MEPLFSGSERQRAGRVAWETTHWAQVAPARLGGVRPGAQMTGSASEGNEVISGWRKQCVAEERRHQPAADGPGYTPVGLAVCNGDLSQECPSHWPCLLRPHARLTPRKPSLLRPSLPAQLALPCTPRVQVSFPCDPPEGRDPVWVLSQHPPCLGLPIKIFNNHRQVHRLIRVDTLVAEQVPEALPCQVSALFAGPEGRDWASGVGGRRAGAGSGGTYRAA